MRGWCEVFAALVVITSPSIASAQTATQLWTNAIVVWLPSDALTSAVGVETRTNPAVVKLTPHVDYTVVSWADVLAEADVEHQADSAWTVTPRFGAQFYIFSRLFLHDTHAAEEREKRPRRRLV
ncbi:MAG TPA: hypothetical protein VFP91_08800, partial [Vicinamibacterales bacterium]|nr:hypothetical protein [Vicinamibacterales bacterium]